MSELMFLTVVRSSLTAWLSFLCSFMIRFREAYSNRFIKNKELKVYDRIKVEDSGIVPFATAPLKGRFEVILQ